MPAHDEEYDFEDGGEAANDPAAVDKHGLSAITGYPLKEIDKLLREGLPTHGRRARGAALSFHMPTVLTWLLDRRAAEFGGESGEALKRREREAVTRRKEIELAQLEEGLVDLATVKTKIAQYVASLRSAFLTIPARINQAPEIQQAVRTEIEQAINDFAAKGAEFSK